MSLERVFIFQLLIWCVADDALRGYERNQHSMGAAVFYSLFGALSLWLLFLTTRWLWRLSPYSRG